MKNKALSNVTMALDLLKVDCYMDSIEIFGVKIHNITFDEATKEMINYLRGSELKQFILQILKLLWGLKIMSNLKV